MARFTGASSTNDPTQILQSIEDEKKKREERALKFGITTEESASQKRKERLQRFKGNTPGQQESAREIKDLEADKLAQRAARFKET